MNCLFVHYNIVYPISIRQCKETVYCWIKGRVVANLLELFGETFSIIDLVSSTGKDHWENWEGHNFKFGSRIRPMRQRVRVPRQEARDGVPEYLKSHGIIILVLGRIEICVSKG